MKKSFLACLHPHSFLTTAIIMAAVIFCVTACNLFYSKENYLKDFDTFVSQVETKYTQYTPQDWESAELQYTKFSSELYQKVHSQLSSEDQQQIGRLKARYEKIKFIFNIKNALDDLKNTSDQVKGAIQEFVDEKESDKTSY